jgi:hypothetical protein
MYRRIFLILSLSAGLFGCEWLSSSSITINNRSQNYIDRVEIRFAGGRNFSETAIEPGRSVKFRAFDYVEGAISVIILKNGVKNSFEVGYLTPRASLDCNINVFDFEIEKGCDYDII